MRLRGILLAAGASRRFGANKLVQPLPDPARRPGRPGADAVALASARNLLAALPDTLAVVRPGATEVAGLLATAGCVTTVCARADAGMGHSLAHAIAASAGYDGWVIALADMPYIRPRSIAAVARALEQGAAIVLPQFAGEKGHPVGFSAVFRKELEALQGDAGARAVLAAHPGQVLRLALDDPGILRDIDTPADLAQAAPPITPV